MKPVILFLALFISITTNADTVKKWTDDQGNVHYGDQKAAKYVKGTKTLEIKDTYDQEAYDEGIERHKETEEIGDQLEKERIVEEEKRKEEENEPVSPPPSSGRTTIINPSVISNQPYRNRPGLPTVNPRPVQLPTSVN
ncbi:MAG: DUF4124 domain-containing protein [Gammaproteobacteria bacterium]|nr:DUF4124 domain-containing protein [Gammaproteobacteria bacterium]